MRRKAQFYMLDALFAAVILFTGIALIVSDYVNIPEEKQPQLISQDIQIVIFNTDIGDIFNDYTRNNYLILDESLTPIQQAHLWTYNASNGCAWCAGQAHALLRSVLQEIIPDQYGANVSINLGGGNVLIWNQTINREPDFLIANQQVVVSPLDGLEILGPDIAEVRLWR